MPEHKICSPINIFTAYGMIYLVDPLFVAGQAMLRKIPLAVHFTHTVDMDRVGELIE